MKSSRRTFLKTSTAAAVGSVLTASGCSSPLFSTPSLANKDSRVADVLTQASDLIVNAYPESASSAGIDNGKYAKLKFKLSDRSPAGQAKIKADVQAMASKLGSINTAELQADEALNVDVTRTVFDASVKGFEQPYGDMSILNSNWYYRNSPYAVAQNTGAFVEIPSFLDTNHSIEHGDDAQAYLERLDAYAAQLDGESERIRLDGAFGVILPDFLMEKTLVQLRDTRDRAPEEWGIMTSFKAKLSKLGENSKLASDFTRQGQIIAEQKILPAINRQIAALEVFASKATSDAGVWAKPNGDEYYQWALQAGTTTTMSPDEIHKMGLDELASIHAQMDPILRSIGYTKGSVGSRMTALAKDPRYHFSAGDKGRAEIMAFIGDTLTEIRGLMPRAFNTQVPGFLEVVRIAPEVEAGAPGAYGGAGSIDGKQPGHYWINLRTPALHNKFTLKDLTYHESIPGHVWQGEYTFKQPLIRSLLAFNAYVEGWALYAEQLADELGVYDESPVGRLGYLQSLAFRACRLVVDTGLHSKRWTREQANEWFVTSNGSNPIEVRGEIDRYCAWPGQACGYKVGHTAINQFRQKASNTLKDKYDLRDFNDAVVLGGAVPMTVLEEIVDNYITKTQNS